MYAKTILYIIVIKYLSINRYTSLFIVNLLYLQQKKYYLIVYILFYLIH